MHTADALDHTLNSCSSWADEWMDVVLDRPAKEPSKDAAKDGADADSSDDEDNSPQVAGQPKKLTKNDLKQMEKERKERWVSSCLQCLNNV